jgi:hypothetical protein
MSARIPAHSRRRRHRLWQQSLRRGHRQGKGERHQERKPIGRARVDPKIEDVIRTAQAAPLLDPTRREVLFRDFAEYRKHQRTTIAYRDTTADH